MPRRPEEIPPHWTVRSIIDTLKRAKPYLRERYRVREIGVFGSYVRNEQGTGSDLDILVELDEPIGWDVVDLKEDLERILGLPVDLVLKGGITRRPRLMRVVDAEAVYA
ncbi:nucleotidyltransferase family protein [Methanoculleus sp.]|uniref:nucleotidyltransferase family protein n=1 Tax=Methanoculleus sp. TaxID=90427 RepID=UPI0025F14BAD|nr:nucleotidyltransferase family protein [Methanoculleus sp.]